MAHLPAALCLPTAQALPTSLLPFTLQEKVAWEQDKGAVLLVREGVQTAVLGLPLLQLLLCGCCNPCQQQHLWQQPW